jgi:lysophospholipase L1-like esterase
MKVISNSFKFIFIFLVVQFAFSQEYQNNWIEEMDAFEARDGAAPLQEGILFTGSSSIRFWKDPVKDFNNDKILNRGFGGSQIIDLIENFDRIILKYHPKKIVIYSGDNDVDIGKSAEIVYGDFCTLFGMIKAKLPDTKVYYIAIKPSINRWEKVLEMNKANIMINEFLNRQHNGVFVDVFSPMIGLDGKPMQELFIEDGLHMSDKGYQLWTKILSPYINDEQ